MRQRMLLVVTILILAVPLPAAAQDGETPTPTPAPLTLPGACRAAVDGMRAATADLAFPEHFQEENAAKTGDEFDVNAYFEALDHLTVEEGMALDYVYHYDGMGGFPVLYVHSADEPPFLTEADYQTARGEEAGDFGAYLNHIVIDDTPAGYLQFLALMTMGGQFYLFWHANYNDTLVICDSEAVDEALASVGVYGQTITPEFTEQAHALDVEPVVEIEDDTARVRVVLFTKWGGFFEAIFTIGREFPHAVLETQTETLLEYQVGIMF